MVNHLYSLLLNLSAQENAAAPLLSQFVSTSFKPLVLTGGLKRLHAMLFGFDPDPVWRNLRTAQYCGLLDGHRFARELDLDPRRVYTLANGRFLLTPGVTVACEGDLDYTPNVQGDFLADISRGHIYRSWRFKVAGVSGVGGGTATLVGDIAGDYPYRDGSLGPISVPASNLVLTPKILTGALPDTQWRVTAVGSGDFGLHHVLAVLESGIAAQDRQLLFGDGSDTDRRLMTAWDTAPVRLDRLAALLVAYVRALERAHQ